MSYPFNMKSMQQVRIEIDGAGNMTSRPVQAGQTTIRTTVQSIRNAEPPPKLAEKKEEKPVNEPDRQTPQTSVWHFFTLPENNMRPVEKKDPDNTERDNKSTGHDAEFGF